MKLRQATGEADARARLRLIERAVRLRADIRQIFADAAHWNSHVRLPHVAPVNPDPDGALRRILSKLDTFLRNEIH